MKILFVATISGTTMLFPEHARMLISEGHTVDFACNCSEYPIPDSLYRLGCKAYDIPFSRSPLSKNNMKAYKELKSLINAKHYDIVHTHTPIASACVRLACRTLRKEGLKVFYTAHGFHFFKGAPLKNWLVYYPVEWICAHWTDVLITINKEDYERAKKHMHAGIVEYISGVGLNIDKFEHTMIDKTVKRKELGIPDDAIILLSVGELNTNKNHETIIHAMAKLNNPKIQYLVAGRGPLGQHLKDVAEAVGLEEKVHILGFVTDIEKLDQVADIFCFPSYREGLGIAALEAMASGLPLITSNVHGINDYSINGVTGFKAYPDDVDGFSSAINKLATDSALRLKMGKYNQEAVKKYGMKAAVDAIYNVYERAGVNCSSTQGTSIACERMGERSIYIEKDMKNYGREQ